MHAPEHPAPEPGPPAAEFPDPAAGHSDPTAELLEPAAERLPAGVLCYQCKYDLVGRAPGEPCPECGLDAAASWPDADLRACHPVYIEHVRKELGALHGVAVLVGLLGVALGVAAGAMGWTGARADAKTVLVVSAMLIALLGGSVIGQFFQFYKLARVHPGPPGVPGGAHRRRIIEAGTIVAAGLLVGVLLAVMVVFASRTLGLLAAVVGLLVAGVGLLVVYFQGLGYAALALERTGVSMRRPKRAGASGLLPLAGLALVPLAGIGVVSWWWPLAAALVGVSLMAGGPALRCARARRVLKGLIAGSG